MLLIGDTATGGAGLSETPVIVPSSQTSDLREGGKTHTLGFFALLSYQHLQRYLIPARPSFYDALSVYPQMPLTSHRFQGRRRSIPIFSKTVGIKGANGSTFVAERPLGIACKHYFTISFEFCLFLEQMRLQKPSSGTSGAEATLGADIWICQSATFSYKNLSLKDTWVYQ